jgi:photosystem II stability/assembly factor-like uncharacterized protein
MAVLATLGIFAAVLPAAAAADVQSLLLDGAISGHDIVAVGERGTILRSSDAGQTWQRTPRVARPTLTGITFAPSPAQTRGWAVGHDALILTTADGGRTWTRQWQGENLQQSFLDVLAWDDRHAVAVGADGLYLETKDGASWQRRKIAPDDFHLNRVSRGPTGTLYLAGERGTLLRSTDAGATWQPIPAPYEGSFYGVLPLGAREILAYGLRGNAFRTSDDGATWQPAAMPAPVLLACGVTQPDHRVVLGGPAGSVYVSADGGRTFLAVPSRARALAEMIALPDGSILALGEAGATLLPGLASREPISP